MRDRNVVLIESKNYYSYSASYICVYYSYFLPGVYVTWVIISYAPRVFVTLVTAYTNKAILCARVRFDRPIAMILMRGALRTQLSVALAISFWFFVCFAVHGQLLKGLLHLRSTANVKFSIMFEEAKKKNNNNSTRDNYYNFWNSQIPRFSVHTRNEYLPSVIIDFISCTKNTKIMLRPKTKRAIKKKKKNPI